jgi:hypothetical protein
MMNYEMNYDQSPNSGDMIVYDPKEVEFEQRIAGVHVVKLKSGQVICQAVERFEPLNLGEAIAVRALGNRLRESPLFDMTKPFLLGDPKKKGGEV